MGSVGKDSNAKKWIQSEEFENMTKIAEFEQRTFLILNFVLTENLAI